MAEAIGLRLPPDTPPEIIMLAEHKDNGSDDPPLLAHEDYREAYARAYG